MTGHWRVAKPFELRDLTSECRWLTIWAAMKTSFLVQAVCYTGEHPKLVTSLAELPEDNACEVCRASKQTPLLICTKHIVHVAGGRCTTPTWRYLHTVIEDAACCVLVQTILVAWTVRLTTRHYGTLCKRCSN